MTNALAYFTHSQFTTKKVLNILHIKFILDWLVLSVAEAKAPWRRKTKYLDLKDLLSIPNVLSHNTVPHLSKSKNIFKKASQAQSWIGQWINFNKGETAQRFTLQKKVGHSGIWILQSRCNSRWLNQFNRWNLFLFSVQNFRSQIGGQERLMNEWAVKQINQGALTEGEGSVQLT